MKTGNGLSRIFGLLGFTALVLCVPAYGTPAAQDLHVSPAYIHIRTFFNGASITISADIPKQSSAIVEVTGAARPERLRRRGRRAGLWMSVGELTVRGAPSVYLLMSTPDLPNVSAAGDHWGYKALEKHVQFTGTLPKQGSGLLFQEFIKLKQSQGLYGVFPKSLKPVNTSGGSKKVEGHLILPGNIAPGNYHILLSVLNNGKLVEQRSSDLPVKMRGLPGMLFTLAYQHAVLYGLAAVFIAIVTGFIMGLIFSGKAAH
jgi:Putative transmembrane protein (Alph_Pro_TM)